MRIVLDECVNPRVELLLKDNHAVSTVLGLGWGGLPDNILVQHLQGRCDVFLTIDRGFEHEHNLSSLGFGIVIVHVTRNRFAYYQSLQGKIRQAVAAVRLGDVIHVGE